MTRLEVEAFLAILRYGSISAASEKLYVTQPALSRRIAALEKELGYELIVRNKGVRTISLTEEGKAFISVANKFNYLYQEAAAISNINQKPVLHLSSIGSVSTYVLPKVLDEFLKSSQYNLSFHHHHSFEAYHYVQNGMIDIALISDDMYSKEILTIPAFQEPFVLVGGEHWRAVEHIHPTELNPKHEIRLPWNPEFDTWHEKWFDVSIYPNVRLDQMSLLEAFLIGENWAIVPLTVAKRLNREDKTICRLEDAPEDRIIYYLLSGNRKQEMIDRFLMLLHEEVSSIAEVKSFLKNPGRSEMFL